MNPLVKTALVALVVVFIYDKFLREMLMSKEEHAKYEAAGIYEKK
jgi:hypothetical protein